MKNEWFKKYICNGVTTFSVIALSILFFFCILKIESIYNGIGILAKILTPIIYGMILAYLLTPIYNYFTLHINHFLETKMKNPKRALGIARGIATTVSLVLTILVVLGLVYMLAPQIVKSITRIVDGLPRNLENLSVWLQGMLENNPEIEANVLGYYDKAITFVEDWISKDLMPSLEFLITGVSTGLINVILLLKNLLIGLIVAVYVLNIKERFAAQGKKIIYSCFNIHNANAVIEEFRFIHRVFGGFIIGKLLDSLIIGIICFICTSIMKMPYVILISVIIGVTNIIPFFGPFIGAIPAAFLILLVDPMKCLYFIIFVLLLQQFDGNILGPKILGDSTGLSSFWVLFSILLFGGLFGFVGMIIGVPTFAVIYNTISRLVSKSLNKKELSVKTDDYYNLDIIDEENRKYIK